MKIEIKNDMPHQLMNIPVGDAYIRAVDREVYYKTRDKSLTEPMIKVVSARTGEVYWEYSYTLVLYVKKMILEV